MSDFNNYRLTGGIFFALLLDSMSKSRLFSRAIPKNKQITQSDVLCDLFRVFNPSFEYTENETNTKRVRSSTFKKCTSDDREYFLYDGKKDEIVSKKFVLSDCRKKYLFQIDDFLNNYRIAPAHAKPFAYRLLALLSLDDSIPQDELLYVQADGTTLKKSELLECDTIEFNSFVLAIWFFVCFREQSNTEGEETYNYFWKPKTEKGSSRVFVDSNPVLGNEFADRKIIFAKKARDGSIRNREKTNSADIKRIVIVSDGRSSNKLNEKDFFDSEKIASIKEQIDKWRL